MKNRVEAFILKTQAGQWMVEVWRDGGPIECTAGEGEAWRLSCGWGRLRKRKIKYVKPLAWPPLSQTIIFKKPP
jgi:hypothetical protein